jgi:hypothetical protein
VSHIYCKFRRMLQGLYNPMQMERMQA